MIPTSKKDFEQMNIQGTARSLRWDALGDYGKLVYMNEAKEQQFEENPWMKEEWPAHQWIVEQEAIILAWNDLDKKEQQAYTTKAQKQLSKQEKNNGRTNKQHI